MKFIDKSNSQVAKFQMGGSVAPAEQAPAQDPMMAQLEQLAGQLLQELGPDGAMMLAEMLVAMAQQSAQPVGAPAEGQPIFRKGGKMKRKGARKC
jgi:hypothetical protein